ncbi:uncharacterized protein N7458_007138 [Penicillium daleae]|uniref:Uncharacterized protein n=1 Tax=Penicillium daleae TaxID=63821 RepID=A0AAD6C6L5_9EURO|nr:uncharacterized protein N7458_007138 [Penicillium daleae]KAJ5450689.1 hypothetical protein N7458_007138 [Penicillium daleae]
MPPAGQGHTQQPCPYNLPHISIPRPLSLVLGLTITSLALLLLLQRIAHHYRSSARTNTHITTYPTPTHLFQMDDMEKGTTSPSSSPGSVTSITSTSPPPASACDVLKPLSQSGVFPSSGAVAARARELMQMQMQMQMQTGKASPSSPGLRAMELMGSRASSGIGGSVQKRSESVQEMREVDGDGVRTWRRVVTEYS